jgi:putative ABC transport system permease protein
MIDFLRVRWSRMRSLVRLGRVDENFQRELAAHLELMTEENIHRGMSPEDARRAARVRLGGTTQLRESNRDLHGFPLLESVWQDVRYGARLLRLNKGFAAVAIISLALGIGANTAIFQLIDAVRLRLLPVKDPQELAFVRIPDMSWDWGSSNGRYWWLTNPIWEQIRQQQQSFQSTAAFGSERFNLARGGETRMAETLWVSGDFFKTVGVPALAGRVFATADDQRGCSTPGAVISYGFWQREYGGAMSALGKTLTLESRPFEIIGIMPANFYGLDVGRSFDVAIPICADPILHSEGSWLDERTFWWLGIVGRLKPGMSLQQANVQMKTISPAVFEATIPPQWNADFRKHYLEYKLGALPAANGTSSLRQQYESPLWILLATAGLVLIIACANLANLMLARASARERELAVRLALGARRLRLVRQLMFESLLMAVIGAALGALLAQVVSRGLVTFLSTQDNAVVLPLGIDWRLLGFAAGLAVLTCLLFGLTPALRATRMPPSAAMAAGGRMVGATRERFGLRRALVVTQIALSLVLVAGALLFASTLRNLLTLDAGFQQSGILIVDVDFTKLNLPKDQRNAFRQQITETMRALPGFDDVADAQIVPVSGYRRNNEVVIEGVLKGYSRLDQVSNRYFATMGTPLLQGRDFGEQDTATSPKVAIVSQSFARKYFGDDAVGKTFHLHDPDPEYQIVGVARDAKYDDLREDFQPVAFFSTMQDREPNPGTNIVIRSRMPLESLTAAVKRSLAQLNPAIDINFHSFQTQIRDSLMRERLMATLSGFFGILASVLAAIGIYGVIAYMVVRRTNEIGIRMALGATSRNVLGMVLREAGVLLAIGAVAGTLLAGFGAGAAKALLFGLKPWDVRVLLGAAAALGAVGFVASYWPAHRAARLQPMTALREEISG